MRNTARRRFILTLGTLLITAPSIASATSLASPSGLRTAPRSRTSGPIVDKAVANNSLQDLLKQSHFSRSAAAAAWVSNSNMYIELKDKKSMTFTYNKVVYESIIYGACTSGYYCNIGAATHSENLTGGGYDIPYMYVGLYYSYDFEWPEQYTFNQEWNNFSVGAAAGGSPCWAVQMAAEHIWTLDGYTPYTRWTSLYLDVGSGGPGC